MGNVPSVAISMIKQQGILNMEFRLAQNGKTYQINGCAPFAGILKRSGPKNAAFAVSRVIDLLNIDFYSHDNRKFMGRNNIDILNLWKLGLIV